MKHLFLLPTKLVIVTVMLELVLLTLTNLSVSAIFFIAVTVSLVAYLLGDLVILPISNNTVATLADMGLSFATIYMFNYFFPGANISFFDALVAAVAIGVGEWFFHKIVSRTLLRD